MFKVNDLVMDVYYSFGAYKAKGIWRVIEVKENIITVVPLGTLYYTIDTIVFRPTVVPIFDYKHFSPFELSHLDKTTKDELNFYGNDSNNV